jgi:hypothetical protein
MQARLDTAIKNLEIMLDHAPKVVSTMGELTDKTAGVLELKDLESCAEAIKMPANLPEEDLPTAVSKVQSAYDDLKNETTVSADVTDRVTNILAKAETVRSAAKESVFSSFQKICDNLYSRGIAAGIKQDMSYATNPLNTSGAREIAAEAESQPVPTQQEMDALLQKMRKIQTELKALGPQVEAIQKIVEAANAAVDPEEIKDHFENMQRLTVNIILKTTELDSLKANYAALVMRQAKAEVDSGIAKHKNIPKQPVSSGEGAPASERKDQPTVAAPAQPATNALKSAAKKPTTGSVVQTGKFKPPAGKNLLGDLQPTHRPDSPSPA